MKIDKNFKLMMQVMSFAGITSALFLIYHHIYINFAYAGLAINIIGLIEWIFIEEDQDDKYSKK
jgi:hypothetical protein